MPPVSEDVAAEEEEDGESRGKANGHITHPTSQPRGLTSIPKINALGDDDDDNDGDSGHDELKKSDGLKLRLELNLDVEIELKARLKGEVVLALL